MCVGQNYIQMPVSQKQASRCHQLSLVGIPGEQVECHHVLRRRLGECLGKQRRKDGHFWARECRGMRLIGEKAKSRDVITSLQPHASKHGGELLCGYICGVAMTRARRRIELQPHRQGLFLVNDDWRRVCDAAQKEASCKGYHCCVDVQSAASESSVFASPHKDDRVEEGGVAELADAARGSVTFELETLLRPTLRAQGGSVNS